MKGANPPHSPSSITSTPLSAPRLRGTRIVRFTITPWGDLEGFVRPPSTPGERVQAWSAKMGIGAGRVVRMGREVTVVYAREEPPADWAAAIFLAGPSPRRAEV